MFWSLPASAAASWPKSVATLLMASLALGSVAFDPADHHVTHVLLDEGHLWGKKRVAIPIRSVTDVKNGVRLDLAKHEVRDLPPVELDDGD